MWRPHNDRSAHRTALEAGVQSGPGDLGKRKGAGVFADSLLLIEKPTGRWARLLHAVEVLLEDLPRLQARALALQIIDDRLLVGVLGRTLRLVEHTE